MERDIFDAEHDAFRDLVRTFIAKEITPFHARWEKDGQVSRDVWRAAGRDRPARHRRAGGVRRRRRPDFRYHADPHRGGRPRRRDGHRLRPAQRRGGALPPATSPPTSRSARWLPGFCSGELITAIAMTEPGAGSRPAGHPDPRAPRRRRLRAERQQDLHHQRHHGRPGDRRGPHRPGRRQPRLQPARRRARHARASSAAGGWRRSGMRRRTPPSCSFTDVRVPAANVLGEPGTWLRPPDAEPAAGAALDRRRLRRRRGQPPST